MSGVAPFVRHMLLCDDVRTNPVDPRKVVVYGLISEIRRVGDSPVWPLRHSFSGYVALTEGRGAGDGRIMVTLADTGRPTYIGRPHRIEFETDPLKTQGVIFRITSCSFSQPGFYWVEFRFNGQTIARQPLLIR
ncbi:MAG TPA: hypothetical protein DDY78_07505 [Planctomycetales bacterium]|jgi:hypothetical protein|nr:hypothetical protein [Planctomycetales bacterium]